MDDYSTNLACFSAYLDSSIFLSKALLYLNIQKLYYNLLIFAYRILKIYTIQKYNHDDLYNDIK